MQEDVDALCNEVGRRDVLLSVWYLVKLRGDGAIPDALTQPHSAHGMSALELALLHTTPPRLAAVPPEQHERLHNQHRLIVQLLLLAGADLAAVGVGQGAAVGAVARAVLDDWDAGRSGEWKDAKVALGSEVDLDFENWLRRSGYDLVEVPVPVPGDASEQVGEEDEEGEGGEQEEEQSASPNEEEPAESDSGAEDEPMDLEAPDSAPSSPLLLINSTTTPREEPNTREPSPSRVDAAQPLATTDSRATHDSEVDPSKKTSSSKDFSNTEEPAVDTDLRRPEVKVQPRPQELDTPPASNDNPVAAILAIKGSASSKPTASHPIPSSLPIAEREPSPILTTTSIDLPPIPIVEPTPVVVPAPVERPPTPVKEKTPPPPAPLSIKVLISKIPIENTAITLERKLVRHLDALLKRSDWAFDPTHKMEISTSKLGQEALVDFRADVDITAVVRDLAPSYPFGPSHLITVAIYVTPPPLPTPPPQTPAVVPAALKKLVPASSPFFLPPALSRPKKSKKLAQSSPLAIVGSYDSSAHIIAFQVPLTMTQDELWKRIEHASPGTLVLQVDLRKPTRGSNSQTASIYLGQKESPDVALKKLRETDFQLVGGQRIEFLRHLPSTRNISPTILSNRLRSLLGSSLDPRDIVDVTVRDDNRGASCAYVFLGRELDQRNVTLAMQRLGKQFFMSSRGGDAPIWVERLLPDDDFGPLPTSAPPVSNGDPSIFISGLPSLSDDFIHTSLHSFIVLYTDKDNILDISLRGRNAFISLALDSDGVEVVLRGLRSYPMFETQGEDMVIEQYRVGHGDAAPSAGSRVGTTPSSVMLAPTSIFMANLPRQGRDEPIVSQLRVALLRHTIPQHIISIVCRGGMSQARRAFIALDAEVDVDTVIRGLKSDSLAIFDQRTDGELVVQRGKAAFPHEWRSHPPPPLHAPSPSSSFRPSSGPPRPSLFISGLYSGHRDQETISTVRDALLKHTSHDAILDISVRSSGGGRPRIAFVTLDLDQRGIEAVMWGGTEESTATSDRRNTATKRIGLNETGQRHKLRTCKRGPLLPILFLFQHPQQSRGEALAGAVPLPGASIFLSIPAKYSSDRIVDLVREAIARHTPAKDILDVTVRGKEGRPVKFAFVTLDPVVDSEMIIRALQREKITGNVRDDKEVKVGQYKAGGTSHVEYVSPMGLRTGTLGERAVPEISGQPGVDSRGKLSSSCSDPKRAVSRDPMSRSPSASASEHGGPSTVDDKPLVSNAHAWATEEDAPAPREPTPEAAVAPLPPNETPLAAPPVAAAEEGRLAAVLSPCPSDLPSLSTPSDIWAPLAVAPSPTFSRTLPLSTTFGFLPSSTATIALSELSTTSVSIPDDPVFRADFVQFLESQTGASMAHYDNFLRDVEAFSKENREFCEVAKWIGEEGGDGMEVDGGEKKEETRRVEREARWGPD
ncbi:hypothetical protein RQP46_010201 [Phenoliferia psychrophenolica]